jgi:hypothetical protein
MKNFILSIICLFAAFAIQAQTTKTLAPMTSGAYQGFNSVTTAFVDTIKSGETYNYVVQVKHAEQVALAIQQIGKVVAADTTVILTIYESMDGVNWTVLQYNNSGSQGNLAALTLAKGALNQAITPDVSGCYLRGRFLKLTYVAPTKTGFKKILYGYIKINTL